MPYEPYVSKKLPRNPTKVYCETCERPYEPHAWTDQKADYGPNCAAWVSETAISTAYGSFYDGGTGEFLEGQKPGRSLADYAATNASTYIETRLIGARKCGFIVQE